MDIQPGIHRRVEQRATADLAPAAGHHVNGARMRRRAKGRFAIDTPTVPAAVRRTDDILGVFQRAGIFVVAVKQIGAFVGVAVAVEDEIDAPRLEHRHDFAPHVAHGPFAVLVLVRVVRAFGVGRMMTVGDAPVLAVGSEIGLEPPEHQAVGRAIAVGRVEADEMDVGVIERIVGLRPGHHAASLPLRRQSEQVEVHTRLRR